MHRYGQPTLVHSCKLDLSQNITVHQQIHDCEIYGIILRLRFIIFTITLSGMGHLEMAQLSEPSTAY